MTLRYVFSVLAVRLLILFAESIKIQQSLSFFIDSLISCFERHEGKCFPSWQRTGYHTCLMQGDNGRKLKVI